MALFWFLAGMLCTLAALILLLPWLRTIPRLGPLPSLPWQAGIVAGAVVIATIGLYHWFGHSDSVAQALPPAFPNSRSAGSAFVDAIGASKELSGVAAKPAAGSMDSSISALESRLAKTGGSQDDWELLAKSYEFLGRPGEATKARARQLPAAPADSADSAAGATASAVSGEVTLAPRLSGKAAAGATLFIVAKSADSPGVPLAVFRGRVGTWPLRFTLDDSLSMLPGHNLSSARRVTVEARISQSGQPLPAPGDLQGSTGVINPADHPSLKILIDRLIT